MTIQNYGDLASEKGFKKIVENIAILRGFKTLLADIAELKVRDQMLSWEFMARFRLLWTTC